MKTSTAAEALAPYLRLNPGAFRILCSTNGCYSETGISISPHTTASDTQRLKAAEKLARAGWTCPVQPLCPDCSRRREAT